MEGRVFPPLGYGCTREVLDPEDPNAEPGAAENYARHLAELQRDLELVGTPDIPGRLADSETDLSVSDGPGLEIIIPPTREIKPLGETDGNAQNKIYSWSEISENARINSLHTQAALQTIEEDYRAGLLARGIALDDARPSKLQMQDENGLDELNRINLESSAWSKSQNPNAPKKVAKKEQFEDAGVKKLVEIVAYHSTPEYQNRVDEILKQWDTPPIYKQSNSSNSDIDVILDLGDSDQQINMFLATKQREQMEADQRMAAAMRAQIDAQKRVNELERFLIEFPERERRRQLAEKEQHRQNMAALEAKFEKEERERKEREETEKRRRLEEQRKKEEAIQAEQKRRLDAIRAHQEAERRRVEKEAADRKAQEDAQRRAAEEKRKRDEEEQRRRQQELLRQKLENEKKQQEEAEKQRKAKEAANSQAQQAAASVSQIQAETLQEAQTIASTMPYLNPEAFEGLKVALFKSRKYKAGFAMSIAQLAPPEIRGSAEFQLTAKTLNQYANMKHNMEAILARVKAIKTIFNSTELSAVKYSISKRVTQMVGSKQGYLTSATEVLKILNGLFQKMPANASASVIAVDDFILPRQKKEGMTAPPALFITMYSFLKTVLIKAAAEGPEKESTMKALGMLINATLGGRAKYWPCAALTQVIYMRMWEFSPSLFGAMGRQLDLGYRDLGGALESPTDVNRRAEVAAALWCHMGILRPANTKREQAIVIHDVHESLLCNLKVPPYLRDEVHYINIRTIMTIAPWDLRNHLGPQRAANLEQVIRAYCEEDSKSKLRALASLLIGQMDSLSAQGYSNPNKGWGCDEWKYWDDSELDDTNQKRAAIEPPDPDMVRASRTAIHARMDKERRELLKRLPEEAGGA